MLRRGIKRKHPGGDQSVDNYTRNLSNFQMAARNRESLRLKNEVSSLNPAGVERHLKDKLAIEMSLIEGTAKFIMASKNQKQTLEAAKTLLVSRLRADMLKFDVNKLRRGRGSPPMKPGKPSYACLSLSNIRIPLLWRKKDYAKDGNDCRSFAVFLVARIGSQIYESSLISPVSKAVMDISIDDILVFNKVPPYFEMILEIYCHELEVQGIASTPQKLARSIGRAVGRTWSKNTKDFENIGPKFELVASTTLTIDDCSEDVHSHELYVDDTLADQSVPLFGQICCRMSGRPYCCEEEVLSGFLDIPRKPQTGLKNHTASRNRNVHASNTSEDKTLQTMYAVLMDWKLSLWNSLPLKEAARSPSMKISVDRDSQIEDAGDTVIIRNGNNCTRFTFEDKENLHLWLVHLIQHAADHRRWKQVAERKMEIVWPKENTVEGSKRLKRTRSKLVMLYQQT